MMRIKCLFAAIIGAMLIIPAFALEPSERTKDEEIEGLFSIDRTEKKILDLAPGTVDKFKLQFVSVTVDQPIFWPNEDVHLKVAMPTRPTEKIKVQLLRKDAAPKDLGEFVLNDGGLLLETIMSGSKKPLEPGEYRVEVETLDGTFKGDATFSVVEGALGALSFAYEFQQLTNAEALEEAKAGWFLGNAEGVGARWGNGLNVKNELRLFNKPFNGKATLKSRCLLPGCNGCEAGPSIDTEIVDGKLAAVLDVGGHSGPFELEVITEKGSLRNLFGRSGHVERQISQVSSGFTETFEATVAPYENTVAVPGREIYVKRSEGTQDSAFELHSIVSDDEGRAKITFKSDIGGLCAWRLSPKSSGDFSVEALQLPKNVKKGEEITIDISGPYSFIALGGWSGDKRTAKDSRKADTGLCQAWAMIFTPTSLRTKVNVPKQADPEKNIELTIETTDKVSGKPRSVWGFLEVFDNRVADRSPKDPLVSAIGDSFRNASNMLSERFDTPRIPTGRKGGIMKSMSLPMPGGSVVKGAPSYSEMEMKMDMSAPTMQNSINLSADAGGSSELDNKAESDEAVRQGEKKVVCCRLVKTDSEGKASVSVTMPPQTGRCKARFVAMSGFDYCEALENIDVGKKGGTVEVYAPRLLPKGGEVNARIFAICDEAPGKLKIFGVGLKSPIVFDVPAGGKEFMVPLVGAGNGTFTAVLSKADGTQVDARSITIQDAGEFPVTFTELIVSDGKTVVVPKNRTVSIFAHAGLLLRGTASNIVTTMKSWFGHSEALSAMAAVDAILLRSFAERILSDDGLRSVVKADMEKAVRDLNNTFFDSSTKLIRPYPGLQGNEIWSVWVLKNLLQVSNVLSGNKSLRDEFADVLKIAGRLSESLTEELARRKISTEEVALFDLKTGGDVVPIVIDGKVVYRAVTDSAVIEWYVKHVEPALKIDQKPNLNNLDANFIKEFDLLRLQRAFERTGALYQLLLDAKALYSKKDPAFGPLFRTIARGMILTGDPGMIQGPAMLGGVYGAPQTMVKFLDLLLDIARDGNTKLGEVEVTASKMPVIKRQNGSDVATFETGTDGVELKTIENAVILIEEHRPMMMAEYMTNTPFFKISLDVSPIKVGEERQLVIELDSKLNPLDYYAVIALPPVISLRQTEDLLADYRGQLLYGQKAAAGESIQFLTVPFRGLRTMKLAVEGLLPGKSHGFVMIRHIANPTVVQTLEIPAVTCQ